MKNHNLVMGRIFSSGPKRGQAAVIYLAGDYVARLDSDGAAPILSLKGEDGAERLDWRALLADTRKARTARDRERLRGLLDEMETILNGPVQTVPYKRFRKYAKRHCEEWAAAQVRRDTEAYEQFLADVEEISSPGF